MVVAIPKGVAASPGPILRERWSLPRAFALTPVSAGAAGGLLTVLALLGALVLATGRDRRYSGPVAGVVDGALAPPDDAVPLPGRDEPAMEFAPPAGVRPGHAGTLLDGVANPRDVTGTIVDLAVRGYLRIEEVPLYQMEDAKPNTPWDKANTPWDERDWLLVRLDKSGGLLAYEQILLDGLFQDATTGSGGLSTRLSELGPGFAGRLRQAQDALYADVAGRGWFTTRPDRVRRRWLIIGGVLFAVGTAAVAVAAAYSHLALIPVPVAVAGLVLIGCARWMPVRTAKGTELARRLLGFRNYLTTTASGPAPAGQADLLDDYLPFAIVFGCTKQWAEVSAAVSHANRAPSWYHSSRSYAPGDLSSLSRSGHYFSPIRQFATTTNIWIATHSASSGGSGSSGFSGGGSSGGGGGGGGSW